MKKWTEEQRKLAYNNHLKSFIKSTPFWLHCLWEIIGFIPVFIAVIYIKENIIVVIITIIHAFLITYLNNNLLWNVSVENHIYKKWLENNNLEEQKDEIK
ncbi:MAG TPA: hypothetical protein VLZ83_16545 [Edaphocola sp.]|nr:hypothetical protein [Edaphocola sp.]